MKQLLSQGLGCAALLLATATPAAAQVFVAPPTPNADRLAQEMRALAKDPGDVAALLNAGELSVKLDDPAAALQFFARAEKLDPGNPRVPAGRAGALVRLGRPGEALRLFAKAEQQGIAPATIAANRALAYDLIGQPAHAQRDYRLALTAAPGDPALTRAYALSLGISGDSERAFATLDPLLRERDRAAWRARAFVLAMDGEVGEAQQIASSMMPGFGTAFSPFFEQLSQLRDPADRAFAVHRGEVGRTPARMADATMAPALPGIVAPQPVQVAAAAPVSKRERTSRRAQRIGRRSQGSRTPIPTPTPAPVQIAVTNPAPVPTPPAPVGLVVPRAAPVVLASSAPAPSSISPPSIDPATVRRVSMPNDGEERLRAAATRAVDPIVSVPIEPVIKPAVAAVATPAPGFSVAGNGEAASEEPGRIGSEADRLASILRGITIPAEELGVGPAAPPAPSVGTVSLAPAAKQPAPEAPEPAPKKPPEKKAEAKPVAPARHWVQVAGGANKDALPREWERLSAAAPDAFEGKSAWTTPLRFTNRLLAGPFDTPDDAQDFVNTVSEQGLSAFAWTSDAGQEVEKLPSK